MSLLEKIWHLQYQLHRLQSLLPIFHTSWQPVLRYGESEFTKESQGTEFFVLRSRGRVGGGRPAEAFCFPVCVEFGRAMA